MTADTDERGTPVFADGALPDRAEATLEGLPHHTRHVAFQCGSGSTIEGEWTGVALLDLLDAADAPEDTTHVLVESTDDTRVCVELRDLPGAMLAFEARRDGQPTEDGLPRLVGERLGSTRAVKDVRTVRTVGLAPEEDPQTLEHLPE